ncbi:MAG: NADH-quinone oxidoreductase subunit A [Bacteroidota bacterium]
MYFELGSLLIVLLLAVFLSVLLFGASYMLGWQLPDTEKLSAYECGFDPYEDARNSFEVRFYLVAILFVVFDLEALFLFPWAVSLAQVGLEGFWGMIDFLLELGIGFFYAWRVGSLEWD